MIIRKMKIKDLDKVMLLENLTFSQPWSREAFEAEISKNELANYIVIELNKEIIGYGGIWYIVGEGHITNIAIHSDFRKKGYGKLLVEAIINNAKNESIKSMTLEVRRSNIAAISLYKKFGFYEFGVRKKYYSDNNEDAIIMWLEL